MLTTHKRAPEAWLGALFGMVWFLYNGAVPSLAYGGHMGHMTGGILFGEPVEPVILDKFMVGGAMALAFFAGLFLFSVLGGVGGTALGALYRKATTIQAQVHEAQKPEG
ncbi:MAG: hypothetical protein KC613_02110 [Myxococcales bacterium]|nr:hypothetical protein [Myxococcales bacterium]MCB9525286.1 hypothetical protein [Myxococcales bacterium]